LFVLLAQARVDAAWHDEDHIRQLVTLTAGVVTAEELSGLMARGSLSAATQWAGDVLPLDWRGYILPADFSRLEDEAVA
jgi:hypothetical protein